MCAFCFEEDVTTRKGTSNLVECHLCDLWVHWACGKIEESALMITFVQYAYLHNLDQNCLPCPHNHFLIAIYCT